MLVAYAADLISLPEISVMFLVVWLSAGTNV